VKHEFSDKGDIPRSY